MAVRLWWLLRWLATMRWRCSTAAFRPGQNRAASLARKFRLLLDEFHPAPDDRLWVDSKAVLEALRSKALVIDARADERFSGLFEPLDKVAGIFPEASTRRSRTTSMRAAISCPRRNCAPFTNRCFTARAGTGHSHVRIRGHGLP